MDEKYLKSLAQEVKGNYVNGSDIKEILSAMKKQPSAWRDDTEVQLRNIFSLLPYFLYNSIFNNQIELNHLIN